ncbi:hypothetical protein [Novilysobacter defluvii]|uniref:Uncharacterized protein n=1 Tax=Lysobacter defluvii IMMIB APB-9 = DSM 18482 TaxID=1385515 RepID=A0A0A0MB46_9GAMM|nr:hypothetical protein [Lysobacter defluvii]KGO99769.1 hypothetical protein N791_00400 [Lysobacter defluvii IMMIB APB-9 = DSM 18482]
MKNPDEIAAFIACQDHRAKHAVSGRWHNLQIRPDLGSGELLNAGVAFVDEGSRVHLRMARDLSRLKCLYDDRVDVQSFEQLSMLIEEAFDGANWEDFRLSQLSAHVSLSGGRYASGTSISEILSSFYEATVPIGKRPEGAKGVRTTRTRSISTQTARDSVIQRLMQRMGQRALPYIARGPWTLSEPTGQVHQLDLPIRAPGKLCATVVSLWAKERYRRKFQLAQAGLDLGTVQAQSPTERLGLFVMRPMEEEGYSQDDLNAIDNEIDEASWQLRKVANIQVEQGEDAESLSEKLEEWLEAA